MVLNRKLVKTARHGAITLGVYRTTEPIVHGIERIIKEEAAILHEDKDRFRLIRSQSMLFPLEELPKLKNLIQRVKQDL